MSGIRFNLRRLERELGRKLKSGELQVIALCPAGMSPSKWLAIGEAKRLEMIRGNAAGAVPPECGPEVPEAPARGPVRMFAAVEMVPGSTERVRRSGHAGRLTLSCVDVFDRMQRDAEVRAERAGRAVELPFTPGQVEMGRRYRDLVELHEAGGVKCSSLDDGKGGGGGFMDAYLAAGREIEAIRGRIGAGVTLSVQRTRKPVNGRAPRRQVTDRALVDMVCLGDATIAEVLKGHGWSQKGTHREILRQALAEALDRMQGYVDRPRKKAVDA